MTSVNVLIAIVMFLSSADPLNEPAGPVWGEVGVTPVQVTEGWRLAQAVGGMVPEGTVSDLGQSAGGDGAACFDTTGRISGTYSGFMAAGPPSA